MSAISKPGDSGSLRHKARKETGDVGIRHRGIAQGLPIRLMRSVQSNLTPNVLVQSTDVLQPPVARDGVNAQYASTTRGPSRTVSRLSNFFFFFNFLTKLQMNGRNSQSNPSKHTYNASNLHRNLMIVLPTGRMICVSKQ